MLIDIFTVRESNRRNWMWEVVRSDDEVFCRCHRFIDAEDIAFALNLSRDVARRYRADRRAEAGDMA